MRRGSFSEGRGGSVRAGLGRLTHFPTPFSSSFSSFFLTESHKEVCLKKERGWIQQSKTEIQYEGGIFALPVVA